MDEISHRGKTTSNFPFPIADDDDKRSAETKVTHPMAARKVTITHPAPAGVSDIDTTIICKECRRHTSQSILWHSDVVRRVATLSSP
jgi:hypothetical protein